MPVKFPHAVIIEGHVRVRFGVQTTLKPMFQNGFDLVFFIKGEQRSPNPLREVWYSFRDKRGVFVKANGFLYFQIDSSNPSENAPRYNYRS